MDLISIKYIYILECKNPNEILCSANPEGHKIIFYNQ